MSARSTFSVTWIVAAVAVFSSINILPNDYCFDDIPVVRDSRKVQAANQWAAIWTTDYWSQTQAESPHRDLLYRPVTLSLFRLTRLVFGSSPLPFHLVSIALNALCAVFVVQLVRVLCSSDTAGLLGGLVFAVLPVHTEVVASVVGQTDLLAAAGTISAILCHFRLVRAPTRSQAVGWMMAAIACAFAAMGAKESGICVVPLVIFAELLGLATPRVPTLTPAPLPDRERGLRSITSLRLRVARTAYLLAPLAAYLVLRYDALGGTLHQAPAPTKTVNVLVDAPEWQHTLGVLQAWGMYWAKTFYPRELCVEYAINTVRLATSLWQFHVLHGLLWAAALAVVAVWGWMRGRKELVFFSAALVMSYLPTSNAFVLIQIFFAERIWYLPSVFVAALVGLAAIRLLDKRVWRIVGVSMLAVMVVRCWVRNSEWKNNGTLFAATYMDHPQSVMARHLYGQWLIQRGDVEDGIALVQKALEIDLGFTDAHRSMGRGYLKLGRVADALRHLQIADMQAPGHAQTQEQLGQAAARVEFEAKQELEELGSAARANPDDWEKQIPYIRLLRTVGKIKEALSLLQESADRFGDDPEWAAELATTLVYSDRRLDAIEAYRRSLYLDPKHAQRSVELAMLLIERRCADDINEAAGLVQTALDLTPQSPNVHAARAEVLVLQGDIPGAKESYHRAIQLAQPKSEQAQVITERLKALGQ